MKKIRLMKLLSFDGSFVDTAGFIALQGLFTAYVTGKTIEAGEAFIGGVSSL